MRKWFEILNNNKKAIENTFNGTGDDWDAATAEVTVKNAAQQKDAWHIRINRAADRFDADMMSNETNW